MSYDFLGCSEKSNFKQKMSTGVIKKQIKSSSNKYVRDAREILTNEDHFPKIISQYGFLSTKLPRLFVVCDISPSSFKLKRGILPSLRYPTCLDKISSVI